MQIYVETLQSKIEFFIKHYWNKLFILRVQLYKQ